MFVVVILLIMVFMPVFMGKRAICLMLMSMAGIITMMDMIMFVFKSMGMFVMVMVHVAMLL
ncbi:MAG: hypothetical protein VR65_19670 [Desulfobulbaceae bacterium BRH_c16a]|nr:MAG: hypothetical protein VR65_19670 [Desulfobulbaceae bacterium BRH_c16a]